MSVFSAFGDVNLQNRDLLHADVSLFHIANGQDSGHYAYVYVGDLPRRRFRQGESMTAIKRSRGMALLAGGVAAGLLLAACGGSDDSASDSAGEEAAAEETTAEDTGSDEEEEAAADDGDDDADDDEILF